MQFSSKNLMLATNMKGEPGDYSPNLWLAQPKWDGHRMVVQGSFSGPTYVKRNMTGELEHWSSYKGPDRMWFPTGPGWTLDGEWLPNDRTYIVFDVLEWDGVDLRGMSLDRRMDHLNHINGLISKKMGPNNMVMVSPYGEPNLVMSIVDKYNLEGTVVKRRDSPYTAGRSPNWQKLVHQHKAVWTFYVHKTEPKLVLTTSILHPHAVAVSESVADELRQSLSDKVIPPHYYRYDYPDNEALPTGNGVFRFWGWKRTRYSAVPRYVQYDSLSTVPFDGNYLRVEETANSQASLV